MKLNIGCGYRVLPGFTNIDKYPTSDNVIFGDLEEGLELPDGCASFILLDNVIEHMSNIPLVLRECSRLLDDGGTLKIFTPHFSSSSSWRDPTHIHHLSYFSFDYLGKNHRSNYIPNESLEVIERKLSFGGGLLGLTGRLVFRLSPKAWEDKYAFVFRASTLQFTLVKRAGLRD